VAFFDLRRLFAARRGPETPFAAGMRALARDRTDEAVVHFTAAIGVAVDAPSRASAFNKRGVAHVHAGRRDAAAADFFAALDEEPRFVTALVNVGNLLLEDGVVDDAIVHYEAALRIDDDDPTAHLNLSVAFKRIGKRAESVHHLRRSHKLEMRTAVRPKRASQD
jgi:tetratricopeptide (TPR) repeat protein